MSTAPINLTVAADGSIPAARLAAAGLWPGMHLRVVATAAADDTTIAGRLGHWPDLSWDDFERGHELALADGTE